MIEVTLKRIAYLEGETLGVLLVNGVPFCVTLEDPWRDNEKNVSCIPTGKYTCSKYISGKFGETYIVDNVAGRSGILFHSGNTNRDTQGCILLGRQYGRIDHQPAILASHLGFNDFLIELNDVENFKLKIES
jgi:hypothetical protein